MKKIYANKIAGYGFAILACAVSLYITNMMSEPHTSEISSAVLKLYNVQTYAENAVTSIYLNYRIYDTIFEALMLLVSVIGVIHFSMHEHNVVTQPLKKRAAPGNIAVIVPTIIVLGLYIIFSGHLSPGGGFQGGAALSSAFICVYLVNPNKTIFIHRYEILEKYLFLSLTILALLFAASNLYLQYPQQNPIYLVAMNFLIGLKVFFGLSIVFFRFVHYEDT